MVKFPVCKKIFRMLYYVLFLFLVTWQSMSKELPLPLFLKHLILRFLFTKASELKKILCLIAFFVKVLLFQEFDIT